MMAGLAKDKAKDEKEYNIYPLANSRKGSEKLL